MFERNRIDNAHQQMSAPAEITLADGNVYNGKFIFASARSVHDLLNGDAKFLEFETFSGARSLIAKSTIHAVSLIDAPANAGLRNRMRESDAFDPYAELGLARGATWDDVRQAYIARSKMYHPDRYAGIALPAEVSDYLAVMARRINAAYRALEVPQQAANRAVADKAKPVFTSPASI